MLVPDLLSPETKIGFFISGGSLSQVLQRSSIVCGDRADLKAFGQEVVRRLYSSQPVANIRAFNPEAKPIIMLRNTIDCNLSYRLLPQEQ
jgi:hypothetical protein